MNIILPTTLHSTHAITLNPPRLSVCGLHIIPLFRQRLRPWANASDRQLFACDVRRAGGALLFGRQPPLRFIVLLLLPGLFLFTLLKGRSRFFCHRVSRLSVLSLDRARMPVIYSVS